MHGYIYIVSYIATCYPILTMILSRCPGVLEKLQLQSAIRFQLSYCDLSTTSRRPSGVIRSLIMEAQIIVQGWMFLANLVKSGKVYVQEPGSASVFIKVCQDTGLRILRYSKVCQDPGCGSLLWGTGSWIRGHITSFD